jgi:hypothetical protein
LLSNLHRTVYFEVIFTFTTGRKRAPSAPSQLRSSSLPQPYNAQQYNAQQYNAQQYNAQQYNAQQYNAQHHHASFETRSHTLN